MNGPSWTRAWTALAVLMCLAGCRGAKSVGTLPPVAPPPSMPSTDGPLSRAAKLATSACPDILDRVSFTPGQISDALSKLGPAMAAASGAAKDGEAYSPRSSFTVDDRQKAWRLIGRAYSWKAEAAIEKEEWLTAAQACVDAGRFASAMSHGDTGDASIGFVSAAECRRVVASRLEQMPPEALNSLANGIAASLDSEPPSETTLGNEAKRAKLSIQRLQGQFSKGEIEAIKADYGRKAKDGIAALDRLDASTAAGYFQSLAAEADLVATWTAQQSVMPTSQRQTEPPYGTNPRPWRDFSTHIFQSMDSFVQMRDIHITRSRLLILSARIEAQVKAMGKAPVSLTIYKAELRTDPFSGEDFRYRAASEEYRLYSVGEDGSDSGGDSDDSGLTPDLVLDK